MERWKKELNQLPFTKIGSLCWGSSFKHVCLVLSISYVLPTLSRLFNHCLASSAQLIWWCYGIEGKGFANRIVNHKILLSENKKYINNYNS